MVVDNCFLQVYISWQRRVKMRFMLAVLFVAFAANVAVAAEEKPLLEIDRPEIYEGTKCLPFFVATTFGGTVSETNIIFWYEVDGGTKRDAIPKSRTETEIYDGPTVFVPAVVDGRNGIRFRLNQAEYAAASACLTKPKPAK